MSIGNLNSINTRTGKISREYSYSGGDLTLREFLRGATVAAYSWIQGEGQKPYAERLGKEFRNLKYIVSKISLGRNPNSGCYLTMWIAKRTKNSPRNE